MLSRGSNELLAECVSEIVDGNPSEKFYKLCRKIVREKRKGYKPSTLEIDENVSEIQIKIIIFSFPVFQSRFI